MQGLTGKTAIITGASRGIGLGIAERLIAEGGRVCITARKPEALAGAAAGLDAPDRVITVAGRADDPEHQAETVTRTLAAFGAIDFLVNNAGINPAYGPLIELDLGAARKIFEVNCLASLAWTQAVHKAWMGGHGGAVLNVASVAAVRPARNIAFYGASKAMLASITQSLALELAPGIRVNAIAPAVVKTRFARALYEGREEAVAEAFPLKRLGAPEDTAGLAAFLLSDESSWLTGQVIVIDGGITLSGGS